ncbi:MAG: hypothetical protein JST92_22360 [Deltaproteobacteria bacterium]|nr:hypothetical protein [Deltaproteobacteria bacterium]
MSVTGFTTPLPWSERLTRALTHRRLPWLAVALGVLCNAPSLGTGLVADDYIHALLLRHVPSLSPARGPLDLFRFADGDAAHAQALLDDGEFPWSASRTVRFSFWRPLTALTHALDYALWPDSPALMHAQNLLWFALALLLVALVYRRLFREHADAALAAALSGLALLLFALDDAHGPAVGWIANRNALIALACASPVLLLHEHARRTRSRLAAVAAPVALLVALLAGEASLAIVAYLGAYALHLERASVRARVLSLTPYLCVVALWRVVYGHLGYGVSGSGVYLDPASQPRAFFLASLTRLPLLLLGQFGAPWSDFATLYPLVNAWLLPLMIAVAVAAIAFLLFALWPLLRADRLARFFATGCLLSLVPVCATFPSDRLLVFAGVGAMGLVAQALAFRAGRALKIASAYFVICHLVLAPLLLPVRSRSMDTIQAMVSLADDTLPREPWIAGKTLVLLDPPSELFGAFLAPMRAARGVPAPARWRLLSASESALEVTRTAANTLLLRPARGFLEQESSRLLRSLDAPFHAGEVISLAGLTITIVDVLPDGRPHTVSFAFDRALDDASLLWRHWTDAGYAPWTLPALGEHVTLPAHDVWSAARVAVERQRRQARP